MDERRKRAKERERKAGKDMNEGEERRNVEDTEDIR
jgi:hypothetical protein